MFFEVNLISPLNSSKTTGPNRIPTKILKLSKNDISSYRYKFNLLSGVFSSKLKIVKVIPVQKKNQSCYV